MADTQDTYTSKIVIDAQNALGELEKLRQNIDAFKSRIKEVSSASGESFDKIAESIKRATEESRKAAISALPKEMKSEDFTKSVSLITEKSLRDYKALNHAVQELNQEEKKAADSAKRFGADGSAAAIAYRQRIEEIKNSLIQMAQQNKISFQDAAKGMV